MRNASIAVLRAGKVPAVLELRPQIVFVHEGDVVDRNLFRTRFLAFTVIRATTEELFHRVDHRLGAGIPLSLALRQQVHVPDLGRGEQVRGPVRASRDARPASDARGGYECGVGDRLRHGNEVGIGRRTGEDCDIATGLDDAIEGRSINHQILHDRRWRR